MPKGLVVYLDDETYKRLRIMSAHEKQSLKDIAYEAIKSSVEAYEEFLEDEKQKQQEALAKKGKIIISDL